MVAPERINARETVGRKSNCQLNLFSIHFVRTNEEIHLSFKNSEKLRTQALKGSTTVPIKGVADKRQITATFTVSATGAFCQSS